MTRRHTSAPQAGAAADGSAAAAGFRSVYGAEPEGVWAAPGRVNLVGEHTDYNGGFVLPFALPQTAKAAAARRGDSQVRVHSMQNGQTVTFELGLLHPGNVTGWAAYPAGTVWALNSLAQDRGVGPLPGVDLVIDSDVPLGAGLSSSAALECSVALAVVELAGWDLPPLELARTAQRAENEYVGVPSGVMDQVASVSSRADHALLLDTSTMKINHVPLSVEEAGLVLLVVDSQAAHRLVDGEYAKRRAQCESAVDMLDIKSLRALNDNGVRATDLDDLLRDETLRRRVRHVLTENDRVFEAEKLLTGHKPEDLGEILNASHRSLREDFAVTVAETDSLVEALLSAGALGARQVGGGFGGSVLALARSEKLEQLRLGVQKEAQQRGLKYPLTIVAKPSDGIRRLF